MFLLSPRDQNNLHSAQMSSILTRIDFIQYGKYCCRADLVFAAFLIEVNAELFQTKAWQISECVPSRVKTKMLEKESTGGI